MGIGQLMGVDGQGVGQLLFDSRPTPVHNPGFEVTDGFGTYYKYAQAGASPLVAGNVLQASAQVTAHQQLTPVAAAIGDTVIVATLGAAAAAENLYAGGKAIIDTTPGLGQEILIEGHAAVLSSGVITLRLGQPLRVALTTSSRVTLVANPYKGVIQSPVTTLTGAVVGVAVHPIAANEWGWVGTGGVLSTLIQGTPAVGQSVSAPASAAGAAAINSGTLQILGTIMVTGVDGKVFPVKWTRL